MPLMRSEKQDRVKELAKQLEGKNVVLLSGFTGMDVATATEMRARLREAKVEFRVVKNTLARLAMKEAGVEILIDEMSGPNAFVMTQGDPSAAAKILVEFEKSRKTPQLKKGLIDEALVTADEIRRIADLPSREVLLAQIAAGFQAPVAGLARLLNELARKLVATLDEVGKQKGAESGA